MIDWIVNETIELARAKAAPEFFSRHPKETPRLVVEDVDKIDTVQFGDFDFGLLVDHAHSHDSQPV
jgi:hypothetical protein